MSKIVIASNRLPVNLKIENNKLSVKPSIGGLATGLKSVHDKENSVWVGWPGMVEEDIPENLIPEVRDALDNERCVAVPLKRRDFNLYYYFFSNRTLWPLFHYFTEFIEYYDKAWDAYYKVNEYFAKTILNILEEGDTVWVHDYQLLLLPKMIKDNYPGASIGFFLHIPFPSYEVFRNLPARKEILNGMLGADLIGFHTYDYQRHFLSSVRRLLGHEIKFNEINLNDRIAIADTFPMGIDYDRFHNAAIRHQETPIKDKSKLQKEIDKHLLLTPDVKLILSIDRLDYTKGIGNRLRAFERFLEKYPEFIEKVTLVMLTVPSRSSLDHYKKMKSGVDELVGRINGRFSSINWTPVWYFYRSMPFNNLIDLYTSCEVALLTPIRDGMNLVAKEYVASRVDRKGVLILSEMAGAAQELSEALVINPHDLNQIADAIKEGLNMPEHEQIERNIIMQDRLKRYDVKKWARVFMHSLIELKNFQNKHLANIITSGDKNDIIEKYQNARKRILFLDYDGTLVDFHRQPEHATPDEELYTILDTLAKDNRNEIVLISGRDKNTFSDWFGEKDYSLIVEHGAWVKVPGKDWSFTAKMNVYWKSVIKPLVEFYTDRTPGTFIEEKTYSIAWHYRKADPELGTLRANVLKDELTNLIANHNIEILEGNKVIEIKNSGINKGRAAQNLLRKKNYDFIFGIGDDWTDEYLFEELPERSITVKVGMSNTSAKYNVESFNEVRELLRNMSLTIDKVNATPEVSNLKK